MAANFAEIKVFSCCCHWLKVDKIKWLEDIVGTL